MALIDSDNLNPEELATEDVTVEALGGEVRVRSLDLVERLVFERKTLALRKEAGGDEKAFVSMVPEVLEVCVLDGRNRPVMSAARWRLWGARHMAESVNLFNVAWRLSVGEGDEKNSQASPS